MRRISAWTTVATLLASVALAGCGKDKPPECASLEAVQVSIEHLRNTNVAENGLGQLRSDLNQLRTGLQQLAADVRSLYGPEMDAVRSAAQQLRTSLQAAQADPDAATLSAVRTDAANLRTGVRTLSDAMSGTC